MVFCARSAFKKSQMSVVYEPMPSALLEHLHNHKTDTNCSYQTLSAKDTETHMWEEFLLSGHLLYFLIIWMNFGGNVMEKRKVVKKKSLHKHK